MECYGDINNQYFKGYREFLGNYILESYSCVYISTSLSYILSHYSFQMDDVRLSIDMDRTSSHISKASKIYWIMELEVNIKDHQCKPKSVRLFHTLVVFMTASVF